jgi:nitrogen fixation NifU-like protein
MAATNSIYSDEVVQHFSHPKNLGEIKNPDAVGQVGNPICGDVMKLYLKITKNKKGKEIVKDIKFQTMGCAAAIATSSMITELAKGKTLEQAEKISNKDVASSLHGLPPIKMHCSNLAADALRDAIKNYRNKE